MAPTPLPPHGAPQLRGFTILTHARRRAGGGMSAAPTTEDGSEAAHILLDESVASAEWEPNPRTCRHYVGLLSGVCGVAVAAYCAAAANWAASAAAVSLTLVAGTLVRGPVDGALSGLLPLRRPRVRIGGRCAAGYEDVERVFRQHFSGGQERGAQCCAFVGGERVVDLWGVREGSLPSAEMDAAYGVDSLVNIFSSTKVMTYGPTPCPASPAAL